MNIPENLRYTHDHEWLRSDEKGVFVGITDFAQSELGDIVYIDITTLGQHLSKGEAFGTVEAVKAVSELFIPISGKVVAVNENLNNQPDLVNADPYGDGWIIQLEPDDPADTGSLLDATAYAELIGA
ncbi:glycine cleavage system protein H [Sphingobacteriales bacterium UPWRP_1]|nr:glycine cleavage system protein H [Sphingobacteriales bacterium TSM_CSM]PSJ78416.1 glycine cleavage system protein H [Sphingobacteriales bacterium UPWRP_1]